MNVLTFAIELIRKNRSLSRRVFAFEYRRAARYDDELEIRSTATLVSPVRLRFDYEIWRDGGEEPLATGHTVHAAMDPNGRPCRLPPAVRELLASMSE
jgi:acyl-CoA thioester hydrolase